MSSTPMTAQPGGAPSGALDRYFKITERGSTVGREIRGGLVTFFTMAYIIVLNPLIIGTQADSTGHYIGGGTEPNLAAVAAVTALVAGLMSILMGSVAKFPIAIATGLGLNAFLAFSVAKIPGMTWNDAMGLVVIEGFIIFLLVVSGFRKALFAAIPRSLKTAISVGIGLFICLVALHDAGFNSAGGGFLQLGPTGNLQGWPVLVFIIGVLLIAALMARRVHGAMLIGIIAMTALALVIEGVADLGAKGEKNPTGWSLTIPSMPKDLLTAPDFSIIGDFSLTGAFAKVGAISAILIIFTLVLGAFFDLMGAMYAVGAEGDLLDENGVPEHSERIMVVDSIAAMAGGAGSISSNTAFIESASGVGEGARTGLASIVTGTMFLLATFLSPVVGMVPSEAAAPALVIVGYLMMTQATDIDWKNMEIGLPAFLTMALMPFTYSIAVGIGAGFISYVLIKLVKGKPKDVHPLMYVVAAMFVVYFAIDPIKQLLGVS
ncbi:MULTISPECIES: NCS2 family permease [Dermacoccus]|uniref:NCS2 family permease n=1 Tax=Dermacoccus abyssi TaxID=322596 RepID=A0ABX5Z6L0_9MICO|nr:MULTISPECIES: NCS2 family permease [Dermacoccus]KLO63517.1 permease [Dermacoccus sp. PE3]MBE7370266.1 NCS2 family permease [Dermacoccus barathri]QEH92587.1 NCS2 family permease [Dermacoccus abyssi]QNK52790.1 NCS2 family permease [Dermacoccus sp. PAMC28757]